MVRAISSEVDEESHYMKAADRLGCFALPRPRGSADQAALADVIAGSSSEINPR